MKKILFILFIGVSLLTSAKCPDYVTYSGGQFSFVYNGTTPNGATYNQVRVTISSGKGNGGSYLLSILSNSGSTIVTDNGGNSVDSTSVASVIAYYYNGSATSINDCNKSTPLPVKLISFKPVLLNNTVALHWVTATEINNEKFEVERCGPDGLWVKIGEVPGNGNTTEIVCYAFVDKSPLDLNYYRLKQTDYNGEFEYSPVAKVSRVPHETSGSFTAYPNPFTDKITTSEQLTVDSQLMDSKGSIIAAGKDIDLYSVAPGAYYLSNGKKTIKLIKN